LNSVVRVETSLTARQLLEACLGIERLLGRVRPADGSKRARVIDIDLLLFGEKTIDEPGLQCPILPCSSAPSCAFRWPMWRRPACAIHGRESAWT